MAQQALLTRGTRLMRKLFTNAVMAAALILVWGTPANAKWIEVETARPWLADYEKESCVLKRLFDEGDDTFVLEIRQFAPNGNYSMTIVGPRLRSSRYAPEVRVGDVGEFIDVSHAMKLSAANGRQGIIFTTNFVPEAIHEQVEQLPNAMRELIWNEQARAIHEAAITSIALRLTFRDDIVLRTGSMSEPMAAMRTCMTDLIAHWGYDPEVQATLSRPVRPLEMEEWSRRLRKRYPFSARIRGAQAWVQARLEIDVGGAVAACHPQMKINDPLFDDLACELLVEHGRFEPALDAKGNPVASFHSVSVVYAMDAG